MIIRSAFHTQGLQALGLSLLTIIMICGPLLSTASARDDNPVKTVTERAEQKVDTTLLKKAHQEALAEYRKSHYFETPKTILENNGVKEIINTQPLSLTLTQYVSILNDYGFFLSESYDERDLELSIEVLKTVLKLAPARAAAHLNIADAYRKQLAGMNEKEKRALTPTIIEHYKIYEKLTSKRLERATDFLSFNLLGQSTFKGACQYVAAYMNRGRLREIITFRSPLDITNSGHPYRVEIRNEGTAHVDSLYVYDKNDQPLDIDPYAKSGSEDLGSEIRIVQFKGKYYLLYKEGEALGGLTMIDGTKKERAMCGFKQQVTKLIKKSSNHQICKKASRGETFAGFQYNVEHTIKAPDKETRNEAGKVISYDAGDTTPAPFACKADIDNDGEIDIVLPMQYHSGAGPGCATQYLALLNQFRTAIIVESHASKLLDEQMERTCLGDEMLPFPFNGAVYIEEKNKSLSRPSHKIVQIKNTQLSTICEFEIKVTNVVEPGRK